MSELLRNPRRLVPALLALLVLPFAGQAQDVREIVSNRLSTGGGESTLLLEFSDGERLEIAFVDGQVFMGEESLGRFESGSALDAALSDLIGQVAPLNNGALSRALFDWEPPRGLEGGELEVAQRLDRGLEEALETVEADVDAMGVDVQVRGESGDLRISIDPTELIGSLLRTDIVDAVAEAVEDIQLEGLAFYLDEDVTVEDPLDGPIMVVGGDLVVDARVEGDVVVINGSLTLDPGARIEGDVRLVDSRLYRDGGEVFGNVAEIEEGRARRELRDELRSELRDEIRRSTRDHVRTGFSPFASISRGISGLFEDLMTFIIMGGLGLGVVFLAKDNLEVVARTASRSPGRSALVGLAGGFLVLPVYVLGAVALAVSIVGIIALPFWLVLFPLMVGLACGLGYFGVMRNLGEWVASQRYAGLDWFRATNTAYAVVAGVGAVIMFSAVANIVGIVPGLGFFRSLIAGVGSFIAMAAACIGFGAVLLTRGGRQPEFYDVDDPFDAADWSAAPRRDADASPEAHEAAGVSTDETEDEGRDDA